MSDHLLQREDPSGVGAGDPAQDDPFALLQEEIAYLENEVRLRDEAILELQAGATAEIDHRADDKIKELTAELAHRDEMIQLLFDQLQQIEEAESRHLEEWGQLRTTIDEMERRSAPDPDDERRIRLEEELEAERRRSESLRLANDVERRAWEAQRGSWEQESQFLKARIAEAESLQEPAPLEAIEKLREENQRLRGMLQEQPAAAESGSRLLQLELEVEEGRKRLEAQAQTAEAARRSGEARESELEEEARRLRGQLAEITLKTNAQVNFALVALEEENQALRRRYQEATRDSEAAQELPALRRELEALREQLEQSQDEVGRLLNDRTRIDPVQGPVQEQAQHDPTISDPAADRDELAALRSRLDEAAAELRAAAEAREQDQQAWQRQWEAQRRTHESERKSWASKQSSWENELAYLRSQLADTARQQESRVQTAVAALAEENRQLRHQVVARPDPAPARAAGSPPPRPPRSDSRPLVDLRAMRAKLDQSQEEIQQRLWKLNQLRNLAQRNSGEPANT